MVNGDDHVFEPSHGPHRTYTAMLAARARNNPEVTFEIQVQNGAPVPTKNIHGIAPQASIIPIALMGGARTPPAIRQAASNDAQVVNLSISLSKGYSGELAGRDGVWLTVPVPIFRPTIDDGVRHEMAELAAAVEHSDIVIAWASGNDGWNARTDPMVSLRGKNHRDEDGCPLGEQRLTAREFMEQFTCLDASGDVGRRVSFKDMWGTSCGADGCVDYNSGGA